MDYCRVVDPELVRVRRLTLVATALGSALAFLDSTVVIVALPEIESDLELGLTGQQWVVLGYALALSAFYLVFGAIGDRAGLRRTFVGGVVVFASASLLCATASNETSLVAGRVLQGVGGAALTTTSLALLRVTWGADAGRAIGMWTSLTSVATVAGPPLGGVIVESSSWRWVFLINVPLAVAVIGLALAGRSEQESAAGRGSLDLVGSALTAVGLAGVTYALVEVRERGLAEVVAPAVIGCLALAGLVVWTFRAHDPVVPPRLLRLPGIAAANLVTLALYAALGAHLLFLPLYVQFLGLSPTLAGVVFVPPSLALIALAPRFGRTADRYGPRWPIACGAAVIGLGVLLLLPVDERADGWTWGVASIVVTALGLSAIVAPITAAALSPAPEELAGVASGLNQTVARIGGVLAVAGAGALAGWVFTRSGGVGATPFDPDAAGEARGAGVDAFRAVIVCVAALAFTGSGLAAALLSGTRPGRKTTLQDEALAGMPTPCPATEARLRGAEAAP
jgi:EmrB/QacA subfamily drug resistance transporter